MALWRASRDLRWVLGVALAIRFFHSDAPLLGTNSWRECDNASIARNYAAHGFQFMRPTVDWGGVGSPPGGVVQMEFPAYHFSVACLYRVFGEHDWLGRWLSILCSLLAIVFLHGLVAGVASRRAAAWAAFFLAILPLNAYYGRAFMVESPMLAALIGGVWAFDRWLARGKVHAFWLAALCIALGCLLKIVSLYIGLPLALLAWHRHGWRMVRRPALWGFVVLVLAPVAWWYGWSGTLLVESGLSLMGDWRYGTDKWGDWRLVATLGFWNRIIFERLAGKHLTWPGFLIFGWGMMLGRRRREDVFDAWLLGALIATVVASRGSWVHEHYQVWFLPPAAAVMGRTFGRKWRARMWRAPGAAVATILLGACLVFSAYRYAEVSASESPEESGSWRLAITIREHTEPDALIVSLDHKDPTALYHARRHGWNAHVNDLAAGGDAFLLGFVARGARYLAARHEEFMTPDRTALVRRVLARHRIVIDDGATFLVRLQP
ncbi:MAG: glycosyltransferase family 39 protein [Candidatus Coatesbacteria bacterium]